jgi:KDO2-lipid IV(A) lauroyltransferase
MYYIVFGLLYLISLLPLRVLYLLSNFAFFIIYTLAGYRKNVVLHNLTIAFPHKTDSEREAIARQFYLNFTDTFIETIKFISASPRFFRKHFKFDPSLFDVAYATGKVVQIHAGHNFNWELVNIAVPPYLQGDNLLGVYLPINNAVFERLFRYIRTKSGTKLISAKNIRKEILPYKNSIYTIGLIADQSPAVPANAYWVQFFGRPTGFVKGPEKSARRTNAAVLFFHFTKYKRGYYEGHLELATDAAADLPEGELTRKYAIYLESLMTAHPEMWLWSHRRWKHEWKPEYGEVLQ